MPPGDYRMQNQCKINSFSFIIIVVLFQQIEGKQLFCDSDQLLQSPLIPDEVTESSRRIVAHWSAIGQVFLTYTTNNLSPVKPL